MPKAAIPPHSLLAAATDGSERYPAQPARVSLVDSHGVWTGTVCASELLRTRVLAAAAAEPASYRPVVARLCEHFEGHGTCNRGHKCRFAHRVGPTKPSGGPLPAIPPPAPVASYLVTTAPGVASRIPALRIPGANTAGVPSDVAHDGGSTHRTHDLCALHMPSSEFSDSHRARSAFAASTDSARRPASDVIVVSRGGRCWRHAAYDATPLRCSVAAE